MNWKSWVPLVLAIGLGLFSAKLIRDVVAKRAAQQPSDANLRQIVVTKFPIGPGQELRAEDLTTGGIAATAVPDGSFLKPDQLVGRVTQIQLAKGQPVIEGLLAPQGAGTGIAALVPVGMRAFTIEVNEFSGVGGMLVPNAHVDVIASIQAPGGGEMVARTIVQNVKVQAVGQRLTVTPPANGDKKDPGAPPPEPTRSVTLLVTPGEAEALELACTTGRPRLVLRGGRDERLGTSEGVSIGLLRGDKPLGPVAIAPTPVGTTPTTQPTTPIHNDPFAYGPTTQPANATVAANETRTISVIKGGQESTVIINIPSQPAQKSAAQKSETPGDSSVDAGND